MLALTQPLPATPWLGRLLLAPALLLPLFVGNGLALRTQGRLVNWTLPRDPVISAAHLGLFVWFAGVFYFATGGPS